MFLNPYKSIVHPHLEYAVTVSTALFKKDMVTLEKSHTISLKNQSLNISRKA